MALKIGFLTSLGVNVGDEFIREGIRAVLDTAGTPYTPLYINKHSEASLREPAEDEAATALDKYWESDLFIQSGAPVYWHLHKGRATSLNSEWHLWMWEQRILAGRMGTEAEFDTLQAGDDGRRHPIFANLGAGSCSPWGGDGAVFLADAACVDFARRAGRRARLTTVRDPVAAEILTKLDIAHVALPCPAFLAAARHQLDVAPTDGRIGVNLMPLGGHFDLNSDFDPAAWRLECVQLTALLRRLGSLVFIAHDAAERDWLQRFATAGERVFFSPAWRDYLDVYSSCALVVANRVHGAVCAAGFGVPGVILGNDTRAQIGCALDLPIFQSGRVDPRDVAAAAGRLLAERKSRTDHFHSLRQTTLQVHRDLLRPLLEQAQQRQPRGAAILNRRRQAR